MFGIISAIMIAMVMASCGAIETIKSSERSDKQSTNELTGQTVGAYLDDAQVLRVNKPEAYEGVATDKRSNNTWYFGTAYDQGYVRYLVETTEATTYDLAALVIAKANNANSFYVRVGDKEPIVWHLSTSPTAQWQKFGSINLSKGINVITFMVREPFTEVSDIELSAPRVNLYVSPQGLDSRNAESWAQSVLTLRRVKEILNTKRPKSKVVVNIAAGKYLQQSVVWDFVHPEGVVFVGPEGERAEFDGMGKTNSFFRASKGSNNLTIENIKITRYFHGIDLRSNNNILRNIFFSRIGSQYVEESLVKNGTLNCAGHPYSCGSLWVLHGSSNNQIIDSKFVNIRNRAPVEKYIHGIYFNGHSRNNIVKGNSFNWISGDPIKFRDASSHNIVERNYFYRSGVRSYYNDWYEEDESPSVNNQFVNNTLSGGFFTPGNLPIAMHWTGYSFVPKINGRLKISGNKFK